MYSYSSFVNMQGKNYVYWDTGDMANHTHAQEVSIQK